MNVTSCRDFSPRSSHTVLTFLATFSIAVPLLTPYAQGQPSRSHEEQVVRMYYAKLDYLSQLGAVSKLALASYSPARAAIDETESARRLSDAKIDVSLSDFKVGPLSDIKNRKWVDLVTFPQPPTEVLEVRIEGHEYTDADLPKISWRSAVSEWNLVQPEAKEVLDQELGWTVGKVLEMQNEATPSTVVYDRYASYSVSITAKGKSSSYKAMFLFGVEANDEKDAIEDSFTRVSGVGEDTSKGSEVGGLLHSHLREVPEMAEWLTAHSIPDADCPNLGTGGFCCVSNRCGIPEADLQRELATPLRGGWNALPKAAPKQTSTER